MIPVLSPIELGGVGEWGKSTNQCLCLDVGGGLGAGDINT